MKGNIVGLFIGIALFVLFFSLSQIIPFYFSELPTSAKSLIFLGLTILGITSIIAGILHKKS